MATRLYFPLDAAAQVTVTFSSGWTNTSSATRRKLAITKGTSAITFGPLETWTAGDLALDRQYISPPMDAGIVFTGATVKLQLMSRENALADNVTSQVRLKIVNRAGNILQHALFSVSQQGPATEFTDAASGRNKAYIDGDTVAGTYTTVQGDRLVVEIGYDDAAGTTPMAQSKWGENATDLPENETQTTDGAGWVEFSNTIVFEETTKTTTADVILNSQKTKTTTADIITKATQTKTTTADIITRATQTKTTTADIITRALQTKTTTADILTRASETKDLTADVIIQELNKTKTTSADIFTKKEQTKTTTADIFTQKQNQTKSITADILVGGTKIVLADIIVKQFDVVKTFSADTIIISSREETRTANVQTQKQFSKLEDVNILVTVLDNIKSILADVFIIRLGTKEIDSDILVQQKDNTQTIDSDIIVSLQRTKAITSDIITKANNTTKRMTADIIISSPNIFRRTVQIRPAIRNTVKILKGAIS